MPAARAMSSISENYEPARLQRDASIDRDLSAPAHALLGDDYSQSGVASPLIPTSQADINMEYGEDVLSIHGDTDLPEDILKLLGDDIVSNNQGQIAVHNALSRIWTSLLSKGLTGDEYNQLVDKYKVPRNCERLWPPSINPEITAIMSAAYLNRDSSLVNMQKQLSAGLVALGQAITQILDEKSSIQKDVKEHILGTLSDSGRLLAHLFYTLSITRRNIISPILNKSVISLVEKSAPSELLFGSNLSDQIKQAKSVELAGKDIKAPATSIRNTFRSKNSSLQGGGAGSSRGGQTRQLNRQRPVRRQREARPNRAVPSRERKDEKYWKTRR